MLQSIKATRLPVAHLARQQAVLQRRTFLAPTAALRADLVQDMYLKEIKGYKLPAVKPSDSEGHVQKFSPPKPPKSPEESDIANELKAYENQQVDVEGQASGGESASVEEDWFEEEPEEEAAAAH
ncbi:F-type H+-transporting ATPase subunit h, partial [Lecanoromycetidae sp. Uapishka_2]